MKKITSKEEWKEKLPFIQALVNGDTVQWYNGVAWCDLVTSDFSDDVSRYRIKAKPLTVEGRIKNVKIDCGPKTNTVFVSICIPDCSFEYYDKLKKLKSNVKITFEEI